VKRITWSITGEIFRRESGSDERLLQNAALAWVDAETCFVDTTCQKRTCLPVSG